MSPSRKFTNPQGRDDGYSLTELLIAMGIFGVLIAFTFGILIQIMNQSKDTIARTHALEQAQLGLAQIDRQVRSGNVILDPAAEGLSTSGVDPYYSMRIYTQVDEIPKCAQWRVIDVDEDGFGNLEFRSWLPSQPNTATSWAVVARDLIQVDVHPTSPADITSNPSTWPPFWVDSTATAGTQAQLVRVTLRLKDPDQREDSEPASVTTVITGRNTVFGYPASACATAPPP
ncbi:MAG: type II secretion system protein [Demequinaceae bacterium]|nr:type II secretion system protein [Demequinaceae bacterium]